MLAPRVFVPARPNRGARVRRGLMAVSAGALLLLGAACTAGTSADPIAAEGTTETAANIEASTPDRPVLVAAAVSQAPAVDSAPALPDWVTTRLEADPPQLALTYPAEGSTVTESYILFSGKAEPGSIVAAGPYEAKADAHGQWNIGLVLTSGQNVATFSTTSEDGVETRESVTVHLKSQDGFAGHDDKPHQKPNGSAGAFEASQKYGSCGEAVPYDVFKGKAAPGTSISVTSPYGGGTATAGADGYWKVKVTFEAAPVGEVFTVTVSDGSDVKTFTFTRKQ